MASLTKDVWESGLDFLSDQPEYGGVVEICELEEYFLGAPLDHYELARELHEELAA